MGKQILVRQKTLSGDNRLLRCEVLSEAGGKVRCKCEGEFKPREVAAAECIPAESIYGSSRRDARTAIQKQHASSPHALANLKR